MFSWCRYHGQLAIRGLKTLTKRSSNQLEIHVEFILKNFKTLPIREDNQNPC